MTDINFDQFKQEIRVAENYLRAATSHNSIPDSTSSKKVRASADGLIVLDASKKESILQQFGRRPLAASQETASRISWKRDAVADGMIYERSTFDGGSVQSDPYWKEGGRLSLGYSTDKASSKEDAFGRYSARSEREKLINRLLVDHNSKKSEGTSGGNGNDTPSTYLDVSPGSREYENTDRYSKPSSIEVPTAASPDSLDTSSDDDNTLFFASDLNTSVNAEIRLDPPVSRPASGPSHDRHYPLESPDVINKNYLGEYDAFSRLTGGEVGRGSYRLDSSERNININSGGNSGSGSGGRSSSWTRGDGEDGRDIQGSRGLSTIAGSSSNSTRLQDSSDESTAINLSPGETATPGPVTASAAVADTSTRHRYNDSTDACNFESDVKSGAPRKEAVKAVVKKRFNKSKEQLQKEAEESFQRQYANKSISSPGDDKKNRSAMDRIEFMQKWYTKSRDDREKQRKEFLQIELMNCTFRPQITKMGDSTTRTRTKSSSGATQFNAVEYLSGGTGYSSKEQQEGKQRSAVDETSIRLHDDAEQRSTQQRWLEKQVVEARLAQFTFQPSINPATVSYFDSMDYKPIYERVGELQKEREDRMRTLKQSHEDAQVDLTFSPQIDTNSRQIADRRFDVADREDGRSKATHAHSLLQQTDVSSRLHREAHLAAMRRQQLCSERNELQNAEMEPARLSKGTEKLAQFSAKVGYVILLLHYHGTIFLHAPQLTEGDT